MSRIEFEQHSDDVLEVIIPPETPMEMVDQLTKSLTARGLTEDLSKSTACNRIFVRKNAQDVADKLIKSLQRLAKDDEPYWTPKSQFANQKRVREMEIAERRAKNGVKQPSNVSTAPEPHVVPDRPAASTSPSGPTTLSGPNKLYRPGVSGTMKSEDEHVEGCRCDKCLEMNKSNYGPKGAGQYSAVDNARRKSNNLDPVGFGPNVNAKAYSTKPGQMSGKAQASLTARIQNAANKKQPVKQWTPEEIAAENEKRGLKKGWGQHLPFPSAEEEIMKLAAQNPAVVGEDAMANQLATMMKSKSMFSNYQQPTQAEFDAAGERMGLGVTEEMVKAAEQQWNGAINNWLAEATKPISQRFASEEEELAYWSKIKVNGGGDDGASGY